MKGSKVSGHPQGELDASSGDMKKSQSRDNASNPGEKSPAGESVEGQRLHPKRRRKGHRKSRKGCLKCKKARTKCNENRPVCDYCLHRNFHCEWPEGPETQAQDVWKAAEAAAIETLFYSSTPVFTMLDFRLFSHFIQSAYPKRPLDNDSVWTHEIPCISSDYDYLLHSILALSASDLTKTNTYSPELKRTALAYRLKAITSLSASISLGIKSFEEGNAMIATCYNLFVQSVFIDDGLTEYMTFIRGAILIGKQMVERSMKFLFHSMWADDSEIYTLHPSLNNTPLISPKHVTAACLSLEKLHSLCLKKTELEMLGLLLSMARALFTSSRDAFLELRKLYGQFAYIMNNEEFCDFTDSTNVVGKLLQSHFVALQLVMAPISKIALSKTASEEAVDTISGARWLGSLHRNIPEHMLEFVQWPLAIEKEAQQQLVA